MAKKNWLRERLVIPVYGTELRLLHPMTMSVNTGQRYHGWLFELIARACGVDLNEEELHTRHDEVPWEGIGKIPSAPRAAALAAMINYVVMEPVHYYGEKYFYKLEAKIKINPGTLLKVANLTSVSKHSTLRVNVRSGEFDILGISQDLQYEIAELKKNKEKLKSWNNLCFCIDVRSWQDWIEIVEPHRRKSRSEVVLDKLELEGAVL